VSGVSCSTRPWWVDAARQLQGLLHVIGARGAKRTPRAGGEEAGGTSWHSALESCSLSCALATRHLVHCTACHGPCAVWTGTLVLLLVPLSSVVELCQAWVSELLRSARA